MNAFEFWSLTISIVAFGVSALSFYQSRSTRKSDYFAKLYDEYNTSEFGSRMECIGEWLSTIAAKFGVTRDVLTEDQIRQHYREYLDLLRQKGVNTKKDPLEEARRSIKAFYIKLLLYYEAREISLTHYRTFVTRDRAHLMHCVFHMTREQSDWWKFANVPRQPLSRNSTDETYFSRIEAMTQGGIFD